MILGFGRSPGEGQGYPLQYSGLENSIDCMGSQRVCMAWRAIPGPLSKRKRRLDSLEAAQGAPRDPRRDSSLVVNNQPVLPGSNGEVTGLV